MYIRKTVTAKYDMISIIAYAMGSIDQFGIIPKHRLKKTTL
jgi:hypothetical protein